MWSVDEESPWNIQSIYDLQYFDCPSCIYRNIFKQEFVNHAYHFHPESIHFLRNINDGSLNDIEIPFVKDEDNDSKSKFLDTNTSDLTNGMVIKLEEIDEFSEENNRDDEQKSNDPCVIIESLKVETFFCDICHSYYCNQKALQNHKEMAHSNVNQNLTDSFHDEEIQNDFEAKISENCDANIEEIVETYNCNKCSKTFKQKRNLNDHLRKFHKKGLKYRCEICGKSFVKRFNLKDHIDKFHVDIDGKCDFCDQTFINKSEMIEHYDSQHEELKTYKCEYCQGTFGTSKQLKSHKTKENHKKVSKCEYCDTQFTNLKKLKRHVKIMHPVKLEPVVCNYCGKQLKKKYYLKQHVQNYHILSKEKCKICGLLYYPHYLKIHIKNKHDNVKNHQCDSCGMAFSHKSSLDSHVRSHHNTVKEFECKECGRLFTHRNNMKQHIKIVHEQKKDYICTSCGKVFGAKPDLKRHSQTVHEGIKRFKCHLCSNAYGQSHELKKHLISFHKKIIPKNQNIVHLLKAGKI